MSAAMDVNVEDTFEIEDGGFFAVIPAWVGDSDVTDRAFRLYYKLRRRFDRNQHNGGRFYARRVDLAKELKCSESSLDRAVRELVDLGALRVKHNYLTDKKQWLPSDYLLRTSKPARSARQTASKGGGVVTGDDRGSGVTHGTPVPTGDDATEEVKNGKSKKENNARGEAHVDLVDGAVASDRARVASSEPSLRCEVMDDARVNETAEVNNAEATLFESASSPADADATPPDSAGPPHDPNIAVVVRRLATAVAAHAGKSVKTTAWAQPIGLLLRRGPTEWATPEPVPVEAVLAVIDWVFGPGAVVESNGFCWADQIRSGRALRHHWLQISPKAARRLAPVPARRSGGEQSLEERMEINRRARAARDARAGAVDGRVVTGPSSYDHRRVV